MRYSPEHKEHTRQRILDAAGRVFRRQGYQGSGVAAVMQEAGLTHGGFYAHFENKEALLVEALGTAMRQRREKSRTLADENGERLRGTAWVRAFLAAYLSREHRDKPEMGCPVPPLLSELGRADTASRRAFGGAVEGWRDELVRNLDDLEAEEREKAALGIISTCVGALSLARGVDDEALAERILAAGRATAERAFLPVEDDTQRAGKVAP